MAETNTDAINYIARDAGRHRTTTVGIATSHPGWRSITITKAVNGFILQIGCKTFVAKDWNEVYVGLAEYWEDPVKAEEKYSGK